MTYAGINYAGDGNSNLDTETGIRYGVINQGAVGNAWYEDSEPHFGPDTCPYCGIEIEFDEEVTTCTCGETFNMDEIEMDPVSWFFEDSEYSAEANQDSGDIFITKSPYFTYAQFCSPCAPGAVHLENALDSAVSDNKGYCFGHDWFDSGKAPYPVYSVETGQLV